MAFSGIAETLNLFLMPLTVLAAIEKLFVDDKLRGRLAAFVFGYEDAELKNFELDATRAALTPFMKASGGLSFRRAALLSPISFFVSMQMVAILLFVVGSAEVVQIVDPVAVFQQTLKNPYVLGLLLVLLLVTVPFDFLSMWITKKLFLENALGRRNFFLLFAADIALSAIPIAILFVIFLSPQLAAFRAYVDSVSDNPIGVLLGFALGLLTMCSFSLFFVTIVQTTIIMSGALVRASFRLLRLNRPIALTPAVDMPLTFIGFVLGVLLALASVL